MKGVANIQIPYGEYNMRILMMILTRHLFRVVILRKVVLHNGLVVIPVPYLPAKYLYTPKLFRNDLIIICRRKYRAASGNGPLLKYGFGGDLQYRCENYAKFSICTIVAVAFSPRKSHIYIHCTRYDPSLR